MDFGYSTGIASTMVEGFAFMRWSVDFLKTFWPFSFRSLDGLLLLTPFFKHLIALR